MCNFFMTEFTYEIGLKKLVLQVSTAIAEKRSCDGVGREKRHARWLQGGTGDVGNDRTLMCKPLTADDGKIFLSSLITLAAFRCGKSETALVLK